jgi:hypothetical protein
MFGRRLREPHPRLAKERLTLTASMLIGVAQSQRLEARHASRQRE